MENTYVHHIHTFLHTGSGLYNPLQHTHCVPRPHILYNISTTLYNTLQSTALQHFYSLQPLQHPSAKTLTERKPETPTHHTLPLQHEVYKRFVKNNKSTQTNKPTTTQADNRARVTGTRARSPEIPGFHLFASVERELGAECLRPKKGVEGLTPFIKVSKLKSQLVS